MSFWHPWSSPLSPWRHTDPSTLQSTALTNLLTLLLRTIEVSQEGVRFISTTILRFGDAAEDGSAYYGQAEREEIIQDIFSVNADWIDRIQAVVAQLPLSDTAAQGG